jgi:hypothetical protein
MTDTVTVIQNVTKIVEVTTQGLQGPPGASGAPIDDNVTDTGSTWSSTKISSEDALKAPLASPTFTGTVSGITKTMVGLPNVDDTSDVDKPVSTAQQSALDLQIGKTYQEVLEVVHTATSAAIDATNGNWQERLLAGTETLTFTNFPAGKGFAVLVEITFAGNTLSYANVSTWVGGAVPGALTGLQRFIFTSTDGGTTIVGQLVGGIS